MNISLGTVLAALPAIGPVAQAIPAVAKLVEEIIEALGPRDQETAKAKLEELIKNNADGHRELQQKLERAARE